MDSLGFIRLHATVVRLLSFSALAFNWHCLRGAVCARSYAEQGARTNGKSGQLAAAASCVAQASTKREVGERARGRLA